MGHGQAGEHGYAVQELRQRRGVSRREQRQLRNAVQREGQGGLWDQFFIELQPATPQRHRPCLADDPRRAAERGAVFDRQSQRRPNHDEPETLSAGGVMGGQVGERAFVPRFDAGSPLRPLRGLEPIQSRQLYHHRRSRYRGRYRQGDGSQPPAEYRRSIGQLEGHGQPGGGRVQGGRPLVRGGLHHQEVQRVQRSRREVPGIQEHRLHAAYGERLDQRLAHGLQLRQGGRRYLLLERRCLLQYQRTRGQSDRGGRRVLRRSERVHIRARRQAQERIGGYLQQLSCPEAEPRRGHHSDRGGTRLHLLTLRERPLGRNKRAVPARIGRVL